MGFFAQRENAQNLQEKLHTLGHEAMVITNTESGEQTYRVITGRAPTPQALNPLRKLLQQQTGILGFAKLDPMSNDTPEPAEDPFEPPRTAYRVAQAVSIPAAGESVGSDPAHGYKPHMFKTPQQEIASIPGFTAGGLQIIPTLGLSLGYNDNITSAHDNKISSWFYVISPAIRAELPSDHSVLALTFTYDRVWYEESSIDNNDHWLLSGDWVWDISPRQDLSLFANYTEGADKRGEGRRQGDAGLLPVDPDEWWRLNYGAAWTYGAAGARGRLSLQAGASELKYTNNREGFLPDEPGTTALDRDWWYWGAMYYWRVAPKTSLFASYQHSEISYKESSDSDSSVDSLQIGVTWDATARTSGSISYGAQKKDFTDPTKRSYDGPAWTAAVSWRPRTYSLFTLSGARNTQEPDGNGEYVLRQSMVLSWSHDWAPRFGTNVDLGYFNDDYRPNGRSDDAWLFGVAAHYTFNPHLRFGASVQYNRRETEIKQYNYTGMLYLFTLEISL